MQRCNLSVQVVDFWERLKISSFRKLQIKTFNSVPSKKHYFLIAPVMLVTSSHTPTFLSDVNTLFFIIIFFFLFFPPACRTPPRTAITFWALTLRIFTSSSCKTKTNASLCLSLEYCFVGFLTGGHGPPCPLKHASSSMWKAIFGKSLQDQAHGHRLVKLHNS